MKRFRNLFLILLALCMVIVVGCDVDEPVVDDPIDEAPIPEDAIEDEAPIPEDAIEVVLGYTGPLSGPAAEYGQDGLNGILMAVDDINAAGGIEIDGQVYTYRVAYYDDGADPTQTMANVERLVDRDEAKVISNMVYTSTAPMLEINRVEGSEFIVMAYTSVPVEYDHANELAIWLPPPFITYAQAMTEMGRAQGWEVCAAVVDTGAYGQGWLGVFQGYWEAYGGTVTTAESGNYYADQDYSTQITAALATNPDVLLVGGPSGGTMLVIEQAREAGFEGGFIVLDQAKLDWIAHHLDGFELLENAIGVVAPYMSVYGAMDEFNRRYVEKYVDTGQATVTTWEAAINYTATWGLVKAMESAGTIDDVNAIVAAVPDIMPMMGDDYPYEYAGISPGGRLQGMGSITIVRDGDFADAASILWWPRTEEEFAEEVERATVSPDLDPKWVPFPPLQ